MSYANVSNLAAVPAATALMPVFWIGFAIAMVPGSALCRRYGTLQVMAVSAVLGTLAGPADRRTVSGWRGQY